MKRFMMMLFTMLMSLAPAQAMGVDAFMDKYIMTVLVKFHLFKHWLQLYPEQSE